MSLVTAAGRCRVWLDRQEYPLRIARTRGTAVLSHGQPHEAGAPEPATARETRARRRQPFTRTIKITGGESEPLGSSEPAVKTSTRLDTLRRLLLHTREQL